MPRPLFEILNSQKRRKRSTSAHIWVLLANSALQYWDSITREDLEFSVGTRMNNWEVKELLPEDDRRATIYADDLYGQASGYDLQPSPPAHRYSAKY